MIPSAGAALFIFAGEDGTIAAWNASTTTNAMVVANRTTANAVYKGIAIASNSGASFLYLTDFKNNHIDVFDRSFQFVKSFTDPNVPAGYAPFGIANIGGQLFVTFAKQLGPDNEDDDPGVGNGFVDVFNSDGSLSKRFASNGRLNSPWAIAQAPSGFGPFSGAILVGNFGDGTIGAYDPTTGYIDRRRPRRRCQADRDRRSVGLDVRAGRCVDDAVLLGGSERRKPRVDRHLDAPRDPVNDASATRALAADYTRDEPDPWRRPEKIRLASREESWDRRSVRWELLETSERLGLEYAAARHRASAAPWSAESKGTLAAVGRATEWSSVIVCSSMDSVGQRRLDAGSPPNMREPAL